jgi:uncharacterized membrane protein YdfJ with MMPL/SSD domain
MSAPATAATYPVQFAVDYPDRPLNRLTSAFRIFVAVPMLIVLGAVSNSSLAWSHSSAMAASGVGGTLFFAPLLMILFRQKTGKLVTSGALILMFAFLVLSTTPGYEIKPLAIGIAAGIIFDATVIRALLVPALMRLLGEANWWMPNWTRTALRMPVSEPELPIVPERV